MSGDDSQRVDLELFSQILSERKITEIYSGRVLKSANKFFEPNCNDWILQEDNDPKHRSKLCKAWKEENGVVTMYWPSRSPDMNPIKNVWAIMKVKLAVTCKLEQLP